MRLACGCATHTYGLDISKPDLNFKVECLKAQAEIERKAAAYDALRGVVHSFLYYGRTGDAEKLAELVPCDPGLSKILSRVEGKEP